jgi:hypothetical protein
MMFIESRELILFVYRTDCDFPYFFITAQSDNALQTMADWLMFIDTL